MDREYWGKNCYSVYQAGPIDHWEDFIHIKDVHKSIIHFIQKVNPYCDFTYRDVFESIMDKLYWAWTKSHGIDLHLRNSDVYVYVVYTHLCAETAIAFKSDNNGTVNLIVNNSFDEKEFVASIPHELGCDWEKVNPPESKNNG